MVSAGPWGASTGAKMATSARTASATIPAWSMARRRRNERHAAVDRRKRSGAACTSTAFIANLLDAETGGPVLPRVGEVDPWGNDAAALIHRHGAARMVRTALG